jgi:hypothetical protein
MYKICFTTLITNMFRSLCDHHQGCKAIEACRQLIICGKSYFIQVHLLGLLR